MKDWTEEVWIFETSSNLITLGKHEVEVSIGLEDYPDIISSYTFELIYKDLCERTTLFFTGDAI